MPAVTSFLGFGHALQRHVNREAGGDDFQVQGVGIISHRFEMQDRQVGYSRLLQLSANPLNEHGERSSFIEEGRCHLTASLVLEVSGFNASKEDLERLSRLIISKMKLAGGDLVVPPQVENLVDDRKSIRKLMPGYALMERRDLVIDQMRVGDDGLDALHRFLQVQYRSEIDGSGNVTWVARRQTPGWIVPIATGFHAVSPVTETLGARDQTTPHRFAESVVTLGEFILASRISSLSELIWKYQIHGDLYLCVQEKSVTQSQQ
jgi:CRISPR-associated protein Csy2